MKLKVGLLLATALAASAIAQESINNPMLPPGKKPGWWMGQKPGKVSAKEWVELRKTVDKQVGFWIKASKEQRATAIKRAVDEHARTTKVSPAGAYTLARLALKFPEDFTAAKAMAEATVAQEWTAGSTDPEFVRTAFVLRSLHGGGGQMEVVAEELLRLYPKDVDIQHAYVKESWRQKKPSWSVVERGMKLFESLRASGALKGARIEGYSSNLWMAAYDSTKKLSHLKEAIAALEASVRAHTDPVKKRRTERLLESFQKKLAQGKYVSG